MTLTECFESLEEAPLGNARLDALYTADSPKFRVLLNYALSPQITFGVKQLPTEEEVEDMCCDFSSFKTEDEWYKALCKLLDQLAARELRGGKAKEAITAFLGTCAGHQEKWTRRILKQDLRLNIGAKDVNKVLGAGTIFQFKVALAEKSQGPKGWLIEDKDLKGKWMVEPKLDGARCVAYLPANHGEVKLYSRTGKEWKNFESVRSKLQEINNLRNPVKTVVLDGEVVSYVEDKIDFQALQSTLFRRDGVEEGCLKYVLFDAAYLDEWEDPKLPYATRYACAKDIVRDSRADVPGAVNKLGIVEAFTVTDPTIKQAIQYNLDFAAKGFEGAMLRLALEPVVMKRSWSLIKFKTFVDIEVEVLGLGKEGEGNRDGMVGSIKCRMPTGEEFSCGSGFSLAKIKELTKQEKQGKLPKWLTVKYQPPLTDDGIPRFPIAKGFRHGDDIGTEE